MKLLIFDLDGTLATIPVDYDALRKELKDYFKNYELDLEFHPILKTLEDAISYIKKVSSEKAKIAKKEAKEILDRYDLEGAEKAQLIEGVKETLDLLKKEFKLAILTLNGKKCAGYLLKKFNIKDYFDLIVSRDECEIHELKPSPLGIIKIMKYFGIQKENTVMIGDGLYDVLAAKEAGIRFIGVLTGKGELKMFEDNKVKYIKNLRELPKLLR